MGEGGGGEEKERFLSFTSLPFSLPFFPFSPETPDTQATVFRRTGPIYCVQTSGMIDESGLIASEIFNSVFPRMLYNI